VSASGKSSNRLREKRRAARGGGGNGPYAAEGRREWRAERERQESDPKETP